MDQIKRAVDGIAVQVSESLDRETQAFPSPVRRRVQLPSIDSDIENFREVLDSDSMASAARSGRSEKAIHRLSRKLQASVKQDRV